MKNHPLAANSDLFRISPKLQELLCLVGQSHVFEDGEEIMEQTMGIRLSAKQIQKVSEHYGQQIEQQHHQNGEQKVTPPPIEVKKDTPVYMMPDGSMLYTREEEWKEIKVGRIFSGADCVAIQPNRHQIVQSHYLCHLGSHQDFTAKWEPYLDNYKNKICIGDGAVWIWNWVDDTYPDAIQILDFYHAFEKLACFAALQYEQEEPRRKWLQKQKQRLLNNGAQQILKHLKLTISRNKESEKAKSDVIRYYENNLQRMQYKTYLSKGYLIGSGAIESAHRHVVQQRLKLSGQRWSVKGAQQIANLRACKKSNQWNQVISFITKAA